MSLASSYCCTQTPPAPSSNQQPYRMLTARAVAGQVICSKESESPLVRTFVSSWRNHESSETHTLESHYGILRWRSYTSGRITRILTPSSKTTAPKWHIPLGPPPHTTSPIKPPKKIEYIPGRTCWILAEMHYYIEMGPMNGCDLTFIPSLTA